MDDTVLKLLEELEQVVDEGRSSPFSNKDRKSTRLNSSH